MAICSKIEKFFAIITLLIGGLLSPASLFAEESQINLSLEERSWIKSHSILKVGNENDWPPFDFAENGKPRGYSIDYLKLAGAKVGLQFEFVNGFTWSQLLDKLRNHELDILPAIMDTPERREFMAFTQHYMVNPTVIVTKDTETSIHSITDLKGHKVAIVKGYYYENSVKSKHPNVEVVSVSGFLEGLEAVVHGDAAAFIGSQIVVHHTITNHFLGGLRVAGRSGIDDVDRFKIRFGVSKGEDVLVSILEKGMNAITQTERQELAARWIGSSTKKKTAVTLTDEENAWVKSHTVKVGVEQWAPIVFADSEGNVQGIAGGFLRMVAKSTGLKFEIITDEWDPLLKGLKNRSIDLLPATYYTNERAGYGLYTEPYFYMREFVYVKDGNQEIKSIHDLADKRIAVVKGYGTIPKIRAEYPNATIVETKDLLASINALLNGDVAGLIEAQMAVEQAIKINSIVGLKGISQKVFKASPVHFFSRIDEPMLQAILQKGLDAVSEVERRTEMGKWISSVETERDKLDLTPAELGWLSRHESIRLGIDSSWPPFEFVDGDGKYAGVSSGYVDAISKRLEVAMEPLRGISWLEAVDKLRKGELDVLPAVAKTPGREAYLNFTKPYITLPMIIATRKDGPLVNELGDLQGRSVGVVKGYASAELLRADNPFLQLVEFTDVASLLDALSIGKVEAVFENLWVITYEIDRLGLDNLKVAAPTPYNIDLSMGVRKDWPELVPILDKALASLSKQENAAIKNAWMAVQVKFGIDMKTILLWAIPTAVGSGLIILVVVVWNRKLGREVKDRIAAEERTRLILESAGEGVFGLNNEGITTFVNPAACHMLGFSPEDLIGQSMHALTHHTYDDGTPYPQEDCHMRAAFVKGEVRHVIDEVMWRQNGTKFPVEYTSTPIEKDGDLLGAVVTFNNISERKRAEQVIADAMAQINASIKYASRIQRSILPDDDMLSAVLTDHFVIWEPRDVVGGDIYWHGAWGDGCIIVLGDCTGHGVPGAFMTIIAVAALERAMSEIKGGDVAKLISCMHQFIQMTLSQHYEGGDSDDGIELGACYFVPDKPQMTYVGARFELLINEGGEISRVKGTKQGMGYRGVPYTQEYEEKLIDLKSEQSFYLASDGLIDQVGGDRKRMFGKKRLRELLLSIQDIPMSEQKEVIYQALLDYQGDEIRRDDVSVIGFSV